MKNNLTVTIGISAYNEEKNIGYILQAISEQQVKDFESKKIIIYSDSSTDLTDQIVSNINDKRIDFRRNKERRGQIYNQNEIFKMSNTDIVVLFEADTYPQGKTYLLELIAPIQKNPEIGFVQGNAQPLDPETLMEKILFAQDLAFNRSVDEKYTDELFTSGAGGRAFTKEVYKKLIWPKNVPEDVYVNLWCKLNKVKTAFQKSAICKYRLPQTIRDYLKKRQKILTGEETLQKYFPQNLTTKYYNMSPYLKIKIAIKMLLLNPVYLCAYLILRLSESYLIKHRVFSDHWQVAVSTKKLFSYKI